MNMLAGWSPAIYVPVLTVFAQPAEISAQQFSNVEKTAWQCSSTPPSPGRSPPTITNTLSGQNVGTAGSHSKTRALHHATMDQIPGSFLLAYVSCHMPGELLRHLSEKDVLVLCHAVIDGSNRNAALPLSRTDGSLANPG